MSLLTRIIDALTPKMDFASDAHERTFKYCLSRTKLEAKTEGKSIFVRPVDMNVFKKNVREHGLEHCPRSNQIIAYFEGEKGRYLEFRH